MSAQGVNAPHPTFRLPNVSDGYLNSFAAIQFIAFLGSVMTLIAAYFSRVKRQATWYNFMISIAVYTTSFLLLFFAGQMNNPKPPYMLCLVQSCLTYAATPFAGACTFGLVIHLYVNVEGALEGRPPTVKERYWVLFIGILPYVIYIGVLLGSLALALSDQSQGYTIISYCTLDNHIPGRVTTAIFICLILPVIVLDVQIYRIMRRHATTMQNGRQYKSMFIRITLFLGLGVVAMSTGIAFFFLVFTGDPDGAQARLNIVLALIGFIGAAIFGSQMDLLEFWLFWRWRCFRIRKRSLIQNSEKSSNMSPVFTKAVILPTSLPRAKLQQTVPEPQWDIITRSKMVDNRGTLIISNNPRFGNHNV